MVLLWSAEKKWNCRDCKGHVLDSEMLHAPNPFAPEEEVCGCPRCFAVDDLERACDVQECWADYSNGAPRSDGQYHFTCYKHSKDDEVKCARCEEKVTGRMEDHECLS